MPKINARLAQRRNDGWELRGCGTDRLCQAIVDLTLYSINSLILGKIYHCPPFLFVVVVSVLFSIKKESEHGERKGDLSGNYRRDWSDRSEKANQ